MVLFLRLGILLIFLKTIAGENQELTSEPRPAKIDIDLRLSQHKLQFRLQEGKRSGIDRTTEPGPDGLVSVIEKVIYKPSITRIPDYIENLPLRKQSENVSVTKEHLENFMRPSLITLTTVNFLLSFCCIVLSVLMSYYRLRSSVKRCLVQILYLEIGLTDFFVGVGVLSQCLILYLIIWRGKEVCDINIPVYITYMITAVAVKMSVFMNCVLGAVRCINITQPFYQINKKALTVFTLLYMITWTTIAGLDLWQFSEKRNTTNEVFLTKTFVIKGLPGFGLTYMSMDRKERGSSYLAYNLENVIKFILPTATPSVICFVLMMVQVYHLLRPGAAKKKKGSLKRIISAKITQGGESKASLTIFLLTSIYVVTSAVSIVTWLTVAGRSGYLGSKSNYDRLTKERRMAASWSDLTAIYFSLSTCPLICSTLTPLTLLLRGSGRTSSNQSSVRRVFVKNRLDK